MALALLAIFVLAGVYCINLTKSANYFVDAHSNCNNVLNQLNSKWITYLGKFNKTQECIDACIKYDQQGSSNCDSYTYYIDNGECWSYINNPIWLPYPIITANCGRIIYECKSDIDCSFNGICNKQSGNCTCNPGWNGYKCGNLSLLPATYSSGYHMIDNGSNTSSWGGSIQYNKQKNIYQMFVAEMYDHCGIDLWRRNSQIMYAESDIGEYNSKYTRKSKLMVPFAHSPDIIYAPNTNEYVLIYVHNLTDNDTPPCLLCKDGISDPICATNNQNMTEVTSIRYINNLSNADDINNWSDPIWIKTIGVGDSNFAAQINDDGSLIGMIRKTEKIIYLITASNWKDNTTYIMHSDANNGEGIFPYLPEEGAEDMFVYKDCDGRWHALFHNRSPGEPYDSEIFCGGHAYSEDGINNWIYGGVAFRNNVIFTNGKHEMFTRRERPHLIFDINDKCTPVALTSGVQHDAYDDATYTLLQPIEH